MNRIYSCAEPSSNREHELQHAGDFPAVLLGIAGHDLRQPLQVAQGTYDGLSRRLDADSEECGCGWANKRLPN